MKDKICEEAEKIFFQISGIGTDGPKNERMRDAAFAIRNELAEKLDPKGIYSYYGKTELDGDTLTVFRDRKSVV